MKYFKLSLKRTFKFFPFVLAVTLVLLIGIAVILTAFVQKFNNSEDKTPFQIALTGDTDDQYIRWGMAALKTLDETRYSIEIIVLEEKEAKKQLSKADISAYIVIPEDFIENALRGDIKPLKYVTTAGSKGIVTMFKNEITHLITDMLINSEKGVYGINDALDENGYSDISGKMMDKLNFEYVNLILHRNDLLSVEISGVSHGLTLVEYYICGIALLLLLMMGIPYAALHIKSDFSLNRLLISKGSSNFSQVLGEYTAHFVSVMVLCATIFAVCAAALKATGSALGSQVLTPATVLSLAYKALPVIIMISAFNIMMFELSTQLISGMLLHFFSVLCLCYVSGCFFPIHTFPKAIQLISRFLPTGIAREYLESCITKSDVLPYFAGLLIYSLVFFTTALIFRHNKTVKKQVTA